MHNQVLGQDYKEKHKLDSKKSQTHRAEQYEVTSFLSTDCELSTETCSKNVYNLGPRLSDIRLPVATIVSAQRPTYFEARVINDLIQHTSMCRSLVANELKCLP